MKHPTDVHVEFVKLVDRPRRAHVPHHPVVQDQVVAGVKGRAVPLVVVGEGRVAQGLDLLARLDVINLDRDEAPLRYNSTLRDRP